ncbi:MULTISPECIES: TOMM precursor leader peptide-binding protein [Amycolatopsis]|uniref:TOMM leader peptide-binding protein n=3 Tax=Amycolatopsis TaxID=1813 RepID=A0ABW5I4T6_9PSEU
MTESLTEQTRGTTTAAPPRDRLVALPVQLIPLDDAVLLRRGGAELKIAGAGAQAALTALLQAFRAPGATVAEALERFPEPDRAELGTLVTELRKRRLLVAADVPWEDDRADVFYWHVGQSARTVRQTLASRAITVIGVNTVSQRLVPALTALGAADVRLLDFPELRNTALTPQDLLRDGVGTAGPDWLDQAGPDTVHCVIAASDFGRVPSLRPWNRFCAQARLPFLPVVQDNLVGTIGPLAVFGETPCYECLRAREASQLDDPDAHRAVEPEAWAGQRFTAAHPAASAVLAELAAVEVSKWFGGGRPPTRQAGTLIEVNVAEPAVRTRRVLRIPRCPVCSPANAHAATAIRMNGSDL